MSRFKGLVSLTKAQYNALSTKDADTLYMTTDELPPSAPTKVQATLTSSGWANKVQTVAVSGLRVSSDTTQDAKVVWVDPDVFATAKPIKYKCATAGQLEITLSGDAPTTNTAIVVIMQNV